MPTSYYSGFDVVVINTLGQPEKQAAQTVDVYNVTDSSSLGTLTTDVYGNIPSGSFAIAAGKEVEFSVLGYTPTLTRITAATADAAHEAIESLTLILADNFTPTTDTTAYNEVWAKPSSEANPIFLGTVKPGETLAYPYPFDINDQIDIRAVAVNDKGLKDVFGLSNAVSTIYVTNKETGTADFSQDGTAANLQINFLATGYTVAKFRRIQYATNSGFTTGLVEYIQGNASSVLPSAFSITRASGSGTLAVYVRIAHSTNSNNFGAWSATKTATFANSGGTGGSSGSAPPSDLYGSVTLDTVQLYWTNNGGGSSNVITNNGSTIATVSSGTATYAANLDYGFNSFVVSNNDGSTNSWDYYYYG